MIKLVIIITLFFHAQSNEDLVSNLIENGQIVKIRGYYESPDTDVFLKNDPLISRPAKFIDYAQSLKIYDDWNIDELKKNTAISLCYGNLTQFIKDNKIQTETNLYKFLSQIDEYPSPVITKFDMPLFIREQLLLPSILDCEYLKDRFVEMQINIYMNFETHSSFETNELDQLICMLKGNFSSVILRPEDYEKLMTNQNSKEDLKTIKHSIGEVEKGQCFYIPSKSHYAIKTDEAWFYSISWIPVTELVNETDCFLNERKTKESKMSDLAFKKDFRRANRETKTGFVSYFLFYLESDQLVGIDKDNFIEKVKKDSTIMNSIQNCDGQCPFILSKLFKDLDIDNDSLFSLKDIFNLDYNSALELNKKIEKHVQELGQSLLGQIENLKKSFTQLKNLADQHGMTDKVMLMLKEKLKEWKNNLSDEEQKKLGEIELETIMEKLFSLDKNLEKDDRSKKRDEARKMAGENRKKNESDQNENQTFRLIEENDETEILADDDEASSKEEL